MQTEHELIILNRPRCKKRGLTINRNGRITLRTQPCKILGLSRGDKICFGFMDGQMYIIKTDSLPDSILLSGRKGQLHGCSVNTVRHMLVFISGIPTNATEIDLIVSDQCRNIRIDDVDYQALIVINRADFAHSR